MRLYQDFMLECDPILLPGMNEEYRAASLEIDWLNVAAGIRHEALLSMIVKREASQVHELLIQVDMSRMRGTIDKRGDPDWTYINWNDVIDFVGVDWFALLCPVALRLSYAQNPSPIAPAIYAYAGRRLLSPPPLRRSVSVKDMVMIPGSSHIHCVQEASECSSSLSGH